MEPAEVESLLADLAQEAGFRVRVMQPGARATEDWPVEGGVCRVHGAVWVVLSQEDPAEARIALLADALVRFAEAGLEQRYLAPAVRSALDAARRAGSDLA